MKHLIDLETWPRREHFAFFSAFEEPFFGLVANVDCTTAQVEARRLGVSFFLYYLYHALEAANEVEAFRYRIENGQVYCYDRVHASATLGRTDLELEGKAGSLGIPPADQVDTIPVEI